MSGIVIRAECLGKKYLIGHEASPERYTALRDVMARTAKGFARSALDIARGRQLIAGDKVEDFWALKDVSFEIKRGEVVGIIGRNGAGKSTLLKVLSRITEPSEGRIEVRGRVASLLEVGTGFHPELTGRENIFLNGAILGMTRAEIRRKFEEIVTFAEVEKFLDTPVKRYSSGMYVRLAFAVAAHLEPEILIVDEVLAVGDAEFQKKCLGKMREVAGGGRTVLFVSHDLGAVTTLTDRAYLLAAGTVIYSGRSAEVVARYLEQGISLAKQKKELKSFRRRPCNQGVEIIDVSVKAAETSSTLLPVIKLGESLVLEVCFKTEIELHEINVTIMLKRASGELITTIFSYDTGYGISGAPGSYCVTARLENLILSPGTYFIDVGIDPSMTAIAYDAIFDYPLVAIQNAGAVTRWLDRPWGSIHVAAIKWSSARLE